MYLRDRRLKERMLFFCPFIHPTILIRKELVIYNNYDINCRIGQDWELWMRLSKTTKFANLKESLLLYRVHDHQSPKKAGLNGSKNSREYKALKKIDELLLEDKYKELFIKYETNSILTPNELDELFIELLRTPTLRNSYRCIIGKYQRERMKHGIKGLLNNLISAQYPIKYYYVLLEELLHKFTW